MKLEIDLVPRTAWYSNLRTNVSKKEWDKIRFETYNKYNNFCGICNVKGKLNCHEIWEYDDVNHIQKLKGFIALCNNCHMIKHIGFAGIQADKGLLNMEQLINHFLKVNNTTKEAFEKHKKESFDIWRERSEHEWKTDLGEWSSLIIKE